MSEFRLYFDSASGPPSLVRTVFIGPSGDTAECLRSGGPVAKVGTFQWTAAVQAVSVLAIRHRLRQSDLEGNSRQASSSYASGIATAPVLMQGGRGSIASSLDYAISKEPGWLLDMFGMAGSRAFAREFIARINSNLKRPGPVGLYIREGKLKSKAISVFLNDVPLTDEWRLRALADDIEGQFIRLPRTPRRRAPARKTGRQVEAPEHGSTVTHRYPVLKDSFAAGHLSVATPLSGFDATFFSLCKREIIAELKRTENFSPDGIAQTVRRLSNDESFRRVSGKHGKLVSGIALPLSENEMLGVSDSRATALREEVPLSVSLTAESIGALAIFTALEKAHGFPLWTDFPVSSTLALADAMLDGNVAITGQCCSLNVASAASYFGRLGRRRAQYYPILLSPKGRLTILTATERQESRSPVWVVPEEPVSIIRFHFDSLRAGRVVHERHGTVHVAAGRSAVSLAEPPVEGRRIFTWFPYTPLFQQLYPGALQVQAEPNHPGVIDNILFAHESVCRDPKRLRSLVVSIRHAWLTLCEDESLLDAVVTQLVCSPRYMTLVKRRLALAELPYTALARLGDSESAGGSRSGGRAL